MPSDSSTLNPKTYANEIFKRWSSCGNFVEAAQGLFAKPPIFVQETCAHVVKNAMILGQPKDVVRLLDELENVPLSLHNLHQVCLARHVHRPDPSVDLSALFLMRLLSHAVTRHQNIPTVQNSAELSRLLSSRRSVDHLVLAVRALNDLVPGSAALLRLVVFQSSLHEKEGECYKKWMESDKSYKLFSIESTKSVEEQARARSQDLLQQLNILTRRYSGQKDMKSMPPVIDVWWSYLSENDRMQLAPLNTDIPWQTHPVSKKIAPYITAKHLSGCLWNLVNPNLGPRANELFYLQTNTLRYLKLIVRSCPDWAKTVPIADLEECHGLLLRAMKTKKAQVGDEFWDQASALMSRQILSHKLEETLSGRVSVPKALPKL